MKRFCKKLTRKPESTIPITNNPILKVGLRGSRRANPAQKNTLPSISSVVPAVNFQRFVRLAMPDNSSVILSPPPVEADSDAGMPAIRMPLQQSEPTQKPGNNQPMRHYPLPGYKQEHLPE